MKNKNLLILSMLVLLAACFLGCSKQSPTTGNQASATSLNSDNVTNNSSRLAPRHFGAITGVLVPVPAKASIIAYNDQYVSEESTCKQDGSFELNNLPPDGYMIRIDYVPSGASEYYTMTIPKVLVTAGNVTNLGNINLD